MVKNEKLFYGIGDIPKNKIRANEKESLEANQVRYYGKEKIDPELLLNNKKLPNLEKANANVSIAKIEYESLVKKLKAEEDIKKKEKIRNKAKIAQAKYLTAIEIQKEVKKNTELIKEEFDKAIIKTKLSKVEKLANKLTDNPEDKKKFIKLQKQYLKDVKKLTK